MKGAAEATYGSPSYQISYQLELELELEVELEVCYHCDFHVRTARSRRDSMTSPYQREML